MELTLRKFCEYPVGERGVAELEDIETINCRRYAQLWAWGGNVPTFDENFQKIVS